MKPTTREWISKAEGDWNAANLLFRARKSPNYDAACFHAQQCAEKYLKARLQEASIAVTRTHDLGLLLGHVLTIEPLWTFLAPDANALTDYAVKFRYPGEAADRDEAKAAYRKCRTIRSEVRSSLGLPE